MRNNENGESILEILSLVVMGALMIVPWFIVGLPNWGWLFIVICLAVLIWEGWSQWKKNMTISRQFWNWSIKVVDGKKVNIWKAWLVLASLQLGWLMLLFHLAIKMLNA